MRSLNFAQWCKAGGNTVSDLATQSLTSLAGLHVPKKRFFSTVFFERFFFC